MTDSISAIRSSAKRNRPCVAFLPAVIAKPRPRRWLLIAWLVIAACAGHVASGKDPLLAELTERGVPVGAGLFVKLPAPTLPDGLDAAAQNAAIADVAAPSPPDDFLRNSAVAPLVLRIRSVPGTSAERVAQRVSVWFVAYGSLPALRDEKLVQQLAGAVKQEGGKFRPTVRPLADDALRSRGLWPTATPARDGWLGSVRLPLLERVQVSGVLYGVQVATADSIVWSGKLDARFANDREFPNQWQPFLRSELGELSLGPPRPYSGFGGYIKATPLQEPAGAIFLECHVIFREPAEWFGGANLLRSKLPIVIQENVRSFRRKLTAASRQSSTKRTEAAR
jgi:hypothetical protein